MYKLNNIDLTTYSIVASQGPGSNIAVSGHWNLPNRTGKTFHSWGDENSIEAYTDASDLMFAGRDILFYANIFGTNAAINTALASLYLAINAYTTLVVFSTPYGDFSVQVKDVKVTRIFGACSLVFAFREPVVVLTGGSLPSTASNLYMFDGIPFVSFGLYTSKPNKLDNLPKLKKQFFTKYGSEGYEIVKRENTFLELNGFIIATNLADFQTKIKALYLLLSSAGTRTVVINGEYSGVTFVVGGFKVSDVTVLSNSVTANFRCTFMVISSSYI